MFQSRMFSSQLHVHAPPTARAGCGCAPSRTACERRRRRAAPSSRTTDRTGAARPPCRSDSSGARRAGAARSSRARPLVAQHLDDALARLEAVEAAQLGRHAAVGVRDLAHACPSASITTGIGSVCRLPTSKSFASCAGVIFTTPVPNAGSAYSSAMIGISMFDDRQHARLADRDRDSARRPDSRRPRRRRASSRDASSRPTSVRAASSADRIRDVIELARARRCARPLRRSAT